MSRFDLNQPLDFAKLTMGDASSILQNFSNHGGKEWDILEGSYNGVLFHVFSSKSNYQGAVSQIQDSGGRRKVKYMFPYRDGQTTDDLGRKPGSFEVNILIFGQRYLEGLSALTAQFNRPTPGTLIHPVRGPIQCVPEDVVLIHSSEERKAVAIRVTFIEHNFTIGDIRKIKDTSVKGALAGAIAAFVGIQNAINAVEANINAARSIKNQIKAALEEYNTGYAQLLTNLNSTFNLGSSSDIPTLIPVNEGGTRAADGSLISDQFSTVASPSDPFQSIPLEALSPEAQTAFAVEQITKDVNTLRDSLSATIIDMEATDNGLGALKLYDNILDLKNSADLMQDVLEKGISSSQSQIINYVTPQIMSLREIAFANGIDVNRVGDLDIMNPTLESTNYIAKGSTVMVPIS